MIIGLVSDFLPESKSKISFGLFIHHVGWSRTIYAILKEGIMGNNNVKLFEIWTSGLGGAWGMSVKEKDYRRTQEDKSQ